MPIVRPSADMFELSDNGEYRNAVAFEAVVDEEISDACMGS